MKKNYLFFYVLIFLLVSSQNIIGQEMITDFQYKDGDKSSSPSDFIEFNQKLYFEATTEIYGREIWVSNGNENEAHLLKDLNPGKDNGIQTSFTSSSVLINNTLYFIANDGNSDGEIWKTDGTTEGTEKVTTFLNSNITKLTLIGEHFYFLITKNYSLQVWISDGTTEGTKIVKENLPIWNTPTFQGKCNNTFIFTFQPYGINDSRVWRSDGTSIGTFPITDEIDGNGAGPGGTSALSQYIEFNNELYFVSRNFLHKTDGMLENTVTMTSLYPTSINLIDYADVIEINGKLYFSFFKIDDSRLLIYEYDGTTGGSKKIYDGDSNRYFVTSNLLGIDNNLIFVGVNEKGGSSLIKLNLTDYSVTHIKELQDSSDAPFAFFDNEICRIKDMGNGNIFCSFPISSTFEQIAWISGLSDETTHKIEILNWVYSVFNFNNSFYFSKFSDLEGYELWKSNGTENGTLLIDNINKSKYGLSNKLLFPFNSNLIFLAEDGVLGEELWKYDGTKTSILKDISEGSSSSYSNSLTNYKDEIFFASRNNNYGSELWKTNGTEEGTTIVSDFSEGEISSSPKFLTILNDILYFTLNYEGHYHLCKTDGINIELLKDFGENENGTPIKVREMISSSNYLYFVTDGAGESLWISDGTDMGSNKLKDFYFCETLTEVNGKLFFRAKENYFDEVELWVTDGTTLGTKLVKDIGIGYPSFPNDLINLNGTLFFTAFTNESGREIWKSDGTEANTSQLIDLNLGSPNSINTTNFDILIRPNSISTASFNIMNNELYFNANNGELGFELWKTNGTEEGTSLVKDINSGIGSSIPSEIVVVDDLIYFQANDNEHGFELWKSDGTKTGTVLVSDILSGNQSSHPTNITTISNIVFFIAESLTNGRQIWKIGDINDLDNDGVLNKNDLCPDTPLGESVDTNGCSESQKDNDNDGVMNNLDLCPDTLSGKTVNENGCSQSQLDDDNDGVMNDKDLCPETPIGETVNENGCSQSQLDDDNDGVINDKDLCPNTPTGETVNENGCSESQLDDDNDGVMNDKDLCPQTPEGETVNLNGCSQSQIDDDNDGVVNGIDLCPDTLSGKTVDENGCADNQLDDDNDGVTNDIDQCSGTPLGEVVNEIGCSESQLDDDGDDVMNDADQCPNTPIGVEVNEFGCSVSSTVFIPDANFEQALIDLGIDSDGTINKQISKVDALNVSSLNVSEKEIESLEGIEGFENLLELTCFSNNLKSLDLSKNLKLLELNCYNNQLSSLDLSQNKEIVDLGCSDNLLTELDVSILSNLIQLSCSNNQLSLLNTNQNYKLNFLHCENNLLVNINLSNNGQLVLLNCSKNLLENLDVTNNTNLTSIYCYDNLLTELEVTKNTKLIDFYCYNNNLSSIDVSKNSKLSLFYCWNNFLQLLDVKNNNQLIQLICNNNKLTSLDISENGKLENFDCSNNQLTNIVLTNNSKLTRFHCYNNQLTNLDISSCIDLGKFNSTNNLDLSCIQVLNEAAANEGVGNYEEWYKDSYAFYSEDCSNPDFDDDGVLNNIDICPDTPSGETVDENGCSVNQIVYIPDANFEQALIDLGIDSDGKINGKMFLYDAVNVGELILIEKNIADLSGIEAFKNLEYLHVQLNNLSSLNVSNNVKLIILDCSANQLNNLDVSKNTELTELQIEYNQFTSIDISQNKKLTGFNCIGNKITSLDLSYQKNLRVLYCSENELESLDLSQNVVLRIFLGKSNQFKNIDFSFNSNLEEVIISDNELSNLNLKNNLKLVEFNSLNNPNLGCIEVANETAAINKEGNYKEWQKNTFTIYSENCSNPDFDNDGVLNENDQCPDTLIGDEVDEFGCSSAQVTIIPDANFEQALIDLGIDSDGIINKQIFNIDALQVNSLDVPEKEIKDLSGIEAFENLQYLYCGYNELTNLDLSKNKQLVGVNCTFNQLSSLNISESIYLRTLSCSDNQLTSLDLSGNIQLNYYYGGNNQLTNIDISNNVNLEYFHCFNNKLANIDVSKNINLKSFVCHTNELTSLDVSENTKLHTLWCNDNQISKLDVSKNTKLNSFWCSYNQLSELNVSENIELEVLFCNTNELANLDVNNNISLTNFQCFNNQISSLDITNNINLTNFNCSDNPLNSLDVSNNVQLLYFYCDNNQLVNIDVHNQKTLASFSCTNNQLTSLNLSNNLELNYFNSVNNPDLFCIQVDNEVDAKNGVNNYNEWYKDSSAFYSENCSNPDFDSDGVLNENDFCPETPIGESVDANGCSVNQIVYIPDANFEQALIDLGIDSDGIINKQISKVDALLTTNLNVYNKSIKELTGIEEFNNLEYLYCDSNELTKLDVSQNTKLFGLYVRNNNLEGLNLDENLELQYLFCENNVLKSLDLKKNSKLTLLGCNNNLLIDLDVTNNSKLSSIICNNNLLTNLDLRNNIQLETLNFSLNQVSSIDFTNNLKLIYLSCSYNNLTTIDLNLNKKLKTFICSNNQLTGLDLRSNNSITNFNSWSNNELYCISIPNLADANAGIGKYEDWNKDEFTIYSEDCSIDEDYDGVPNDLDDCLGTPFGATVNFNGCILLPSNNFKIETINETCPNKNNGQINIETTESYNYLATINSNEYSLTNDLKIENLEPGTYDICIIVPNVTSKQCYTIEIEEGETVSGKASTTANKTSIVIEKGTAPFDVIVNGQLLYKTMSSTFDLNNKHGDLIEIKTAISCEGVFSKTINLYEEIVVFPNPTKGIFEVALPLSLKEIKIELFTISSQLISSGIYQVINGKVQLDIRNKPNAVYLIKVHLENPVSVKIIKE